ncbi:MAG: hypothetical protein JWO36_4982 [Myxococcales bacterium]|nr:hypothetical protein [Myxococcales bacterium]
MFGVRSLAIAFGCITACTIVGNEGAPSPATTLNETVFRCRVEPILARQCSFNACHGNPGSPLRIYTPGKLRAATPANIDDAIAALTEAEQHANFVSAAGFNFGLTSVDDNWLLRKPLPAREGGYEHKGGAIYTGGSDPQYVAIRLWLTGMGTCP